MVLKKVLFMLATAGGLGYFSPFPGTLGSLLGVLLALASRAHPLMTLIILSILGFVSSAYVAKSTAQEDPQFVIIDEVAGQMLALLNIAWGNKWFIGFILFRLLDIWKPGPIKYCEKLSGGIMLDDLLAGLVVNLILRIL